MGRRGAAVVLVLAAAEVVAVTVDAAAGAVAS